MPNNLLFHFCISTMIKRQPSTTTEDDHNPPPLYTNSLFNSLSTPTKSQYSSSSSNHQMDISSSSDDDDDSISDADYDSPDFTTLYTSDRFFFSCPGQSNSIIHSTSTSTTTPVLSSSSSSSIAAVSSTSGTSFHDVEAVETDSPDPYTDFRRSMQEVVEANGLHIGDVVRDNWNGLHQLLLCYLSLNPKDTHKFIVGAFADLVGSLMPSSSSSSTVAEDRE